MLCMLCALQRGNATGMSCPVLLAGDQYWRQTSCCTAFRQTGAMALSLPQDVLYKIFKLLQLTEKVRCQQVCRAWNDSLRNPCDPNVWGAIRIGKAQLHLTDKAPTVETRRLWIRAFRPISRQAASQAKRVTAISSFACVSSF